jgi:dihydroorotase
MLGLETALAVAYSALCASPAEGDDGAGFGWVPRDGGAALSMRDLFALFSWQPARIAGLGQDARGGQSGRGGQGGPLRPGVAANLTVFDPTVEWVVDASRQASRSRNTPYAGRRLTGKVRHTVFAGEVVVRDGAAQR